MSSSALRRRDGFYELHLEVTPGNWLYYQIEKIPGCTNRPWQARQWYGGDSWGEPRYYDRLRDAREDLELEHL